MGAENPMLSTERRVIENILRLSSVTHGPSSGPAGQVGRGGGGDEKDYIPSRDELWQFAHEHFPVMHDLYAKLVENLDTSGRRSLLDEYKSIFEVGKILETLTETMNYYTAKISAVFLHFFDTDERTTTQAQHGSDDPKYVRLATADIGKKRVQGYDATSHDMKDFCENKKSLELAVLFRELLGSACDNPAFPPKTPLLSRANDESVMRDLFEGPVEYFNHLFEFFDKKNLRFEVKAVSCGVGGRGMPDLSVNVASDNMVGDKLTWVTEYLTMFEYKKPNAGFWIPWKLFNGKKLTKDEEAAFFELQNLPADQQTKKKLKVWQEDNRARWVGAREFFNQVGRKKVHVKYDAKPTPKSANQQKEVRFVENGPEIDSNMQIDHGIISNEEFDPNRMDVDYDKTSEEQANALEIAPNELPTNQKLSPSFFVNDTDGPKDVTELLSISKLKTCFISFYNALAQVVIKYAVPNYCSRVVIADGLTVISGSLHRVERSQANSNPLGSEHVLDVHFYKTHMFQLHDNDSFLLMLNLLCNSAMSSSRFRDFGFQLLKKAKKDSPIRNITEADREALKKFAKEHRFAFDPQHHCLKSEALEKSNELLVKRMRASVNQAVVEFGDMFPELEAKPLVVPSEAFAIRELFRGVDDDVDGSESPPHGRSKSVAKVQLVGDPKGKHYVLKEYLGDDESLARMRRELKAYSRVAKLPKIQKHVAELITFGALDMHSGTPRLFLLLEYVDGPKEVAMDDDLASAEVAKVDKLLRSVGVCHNDLEDRNYSWQRSSDGSWSIKVFDFDHATFNDGLAMKPRSAATTKARGA